MSEQGQEKNQAKLSGWAVSYIAVACLGYWLARTDVISTVWAVALGTGLAVVLFIARCAVGAAGKYQPPSARR